MADSQQTIDWDAVRRAADDCLNATWSLVCFAERSTGSDYDSDVAAVHLTAIDRARDTFRPAMEVLQPGLECATDVSIRYSPVFDTLALATAGQSERPDFRYGLVCCATAHEAAFELLRWAILWVENGLNAELDERGLPNQYVAGIDDLHELSPEELRDTLVRLERRESLQGLVRGRGVRQIRAWIEREWATAKANAIHVPTPKPLTEQQQEVYDLIKDEGPLTGPQIATRLGGLSSESVLTSHYVPALKDHGIKNRRGLGYYHPDHYSPE
jgi:hypothetical protein